MSGAVLGGVGSTDVRAVVWVAVVLGLVGVSGTVAADEPVAQEARTCDSALQLSRKLTTENRALNDRLVAVREQAATERKALIEKHRAELAAQTVALAEARAALARQTQVATRVSEASRDHDALVSQIRTVALELAEEVRALKEQLAARDEVDAAQARVEVAARVDRAAREAAARKSPDYAAFMAELTRVRGGEASK